MQRSACEDVIKGVAHTGINVAAQSRLQVGCQEGSEPTSTYEIMVSARALGVDKLDYGTQIGVGVCVYESDSSHPLVEGWSGWQPYAVVF
eukprot:SAG11_NODE_14525_length_609_cov_0.805882_2_plen_89_part_01